MNADKGEARGNRRDAEDTEEKAKRDPSAGLRQRRRPQDDDARPIVRGAECAGRGLAGWAAWLTSWQAGAQQAAPLPWLARGSVSTLRRERVAGGRRTLYNLCWTLGNCGNF